MTTEWSRGRGSAYRIQRNMYAWMVSARFSDAHVTDTSMPCPSCTNTMVLGGHGKAAAEVDRVIPDLDYREGNILYICNGCNSARSELQTHRRDWTNVHAYQRDVLMMSSGVTVPTVTESKLWWQSMRDNSEERRISRYA